MAVKKKESLLPSWVVPFVLKFAPFPVGFLVYLIFGKTLMISFMIWFPAIFLLSLIYWFYIFGRFYLPVFIGPDGRCSAKGDEKKKCRFFIESSATWVGCANLEGGKCRLRKR